MNDKTKTKPPYTGPSQLVTEEFGRRIVVAVYKQARRMDVHVTNGYGPRKVLP